MYSAGLTWSGMLRRNSPSWSFRALQHIGDNMPPPHFHGSFRFTNVWIKLFMCLLEKLKHGSGLEYSKSVRLTGKYKSKLLLPFSWIET